MTTLVSLVLLGFFLGMRHATDADHVIAVATIVAGQRRLGSAALVGALWGLGHMVTVMIVGVAIIVFSVVIPPRLGLLMEFSVGVMLVVLGVANLTGVQGWLRGVLALPGGARALHHHTHAHGDYAHNHVHGHGSVGHGHEEEQTPQAWLDRRFGGLGLYQLLRPLAVGVVHGLAGSAAVALLVLTTMPDPHWGVLYLLLFGVGTITGMMLITLLIAAPLVYSAERLPRLNAHLRVASGMLSLVFGLFLMLYIGAVDGLFSVKLH